jgi:hypothetical protein
MLSKVKKIFFTSAFGILYVSFVGQLAYAVVRLFADVENALMLLGLLSVEWLVLIAARFLSKRSAGGGNRDLYANNRRH